MQQRDGTATRAADGSYTPVPTLAGTSVVHPPARPQPPANVAPVFQALRMPSNVSPHTQQQQQQQEEQAANEMGDAWSSLSSPPAMVQLPRSPVIANDQAPLSVLPIDGGDFFTHSTGALEAGLSSSSSQPSVLPIVTNILLPPPLPTVTSPATPYGSTSILNPPPPGLGGFVAGGGAVDTISNGSVVSSSGGEVVAWGGGGAGAVGPGGVSGAGIGMFTSLNPDPSPNASSLLSEIGSVVSDSDGVARQGSMDAPSLPLILRGGVRNRRVRRTAGGGISIPQDHFPFSSSFTTTAEGSTNGSHSSLRGSMSPGSHPLVHLRSPGGMVQPPPAAQPPNSSQHQRSTSPLVGFSDRPSLESVPPFRLPPLHSAPNGVATPTQELRVLRCPHTPGELSLSSAGSLLEDSIEYNPNTSPEIDSALGTMGYAPYNMPPPPTHHRFGGIGQPPSAQMRSSSTSSRGSTRGAQSVTVYHPTGAGVVPPSATPPEPLGSMSPLSRGASSSQENMHFMTSVLSPPPGLRLSNRSHSPRTPSLMEESSPISESPPGGSFFAMARDRRGTVSPPTGPGSSALDPLGRRPSDEEVTPMAASASPQRHQLQLLSSPPLVVSSTSPQHVQQPPPPPPAAQQHLQQPPNRIVAPNGLTAFSRGLE